jgi:hypothetical protein
MRDEKNAEYRSVIKNTLEFDVDIMKRYVNFMSNPDERTAIDQFGKGDKCFGVTALMSTLPGLPMFGHGQIEGFTEKYGMEYYRPRYDETADHWLVERHQREIAPLLKRRWVFAESHNFLLYDFFEASGSVDENVFAYSNRAGNERGLVIFNNRYGETHGTIHNSAAYADKGSAQLRQQRVSDGLGFRGDSNAILSYRDSFSGLEYLRRAGDLAERGLTFHLHAYQCHVFMDWHEKWSSKEKPWDRLCDQLNGRGVPSLEDALIDMELQPVHHALRQLLDQDMIRLLTDIAEHPRTTATTGSVSAAVDRKQNRKRSELFNLAWTRCEAFLRIAQSTYRTHAPAPQEMTMPGLVGPSFRERLTAAMRIPVVEALSPEPWTAAARRVLPSPSPQMTATAMWGPVIAWCALETLAESISAETPESTALEMFDRLRLRKPLAESFNALGFDGEAGWRAASRIKVLLVTESKSREAAPKSNPPETTKAEPPKPSSETKAAEISKPSIDAPVANPIVAGLPRDLWSDPDVRWLAGAHDAGDSTYLVLEPFEELLWWLQVPTLLRIAESATPSRVDVQKMNSAVRTARADAEKAGYRLQTMLGEAEPETSSAKSVRETPTQSEPDPGSSAPESIEEVEEKQT